MADHTVEKIGGTSMLKFADVLDNVIIGGRANEEIYNRIFVVSAYGGITDMLLEHKKTHELGVYGLYAEDNSTWAWGNALTEVGERMCGINAELEPLGLDLQVADSFVRERIEGARSCLMDLHRLCSFGHFQLEEHLLTVREMLSAIGEAHSAYNTAQVLNAQGINAKFVDLTGWRESGNAPFRERIRDTFSGMDLSSELPIVTGYVHCSEMLMATYDRGYSEITFSMIAQITEASEGIIHKEFHLSSGDPNIIGVDRVEVIGNTNYDVADQLSNLGMEAIHPSAAKGLRQNNIPIRVKNTFEPEHSGTLISNDYRSETPCVEIIAGRKNVYAVQFMDQDMVGKNGYESRLLDYFKRYKLRYIAKDLNANTITHYVSASLKTVNSLIEELEADYPQANIIVQKVALVSVIGSHMDVPGLLAQAVSSLADANINVLALHQSIRQIDIQFVVDEDYFEETVKTLHSALIETKSDHEIGYNAV